MGGRAARLTRRDIEHVFGSGWSIALRLMVAKGVWRQDRAPGRATVVSGRKLGGAVVRNRARRRLSEALRQAERPVPEGLDLVLVARPMLLEAEARELALEVEHVLERVAAEAGDQRPSEAKAT